MRARLLAIATLLLLVPSTSSAYNLLNPARRWFPADLLRTVTVDNGGLASINDGDHGVSAAVSAVEAWNGTGINLVDGVAGSVTYQLGDGLSHLIFADPLKICTGTCLAATTTGYYSTSQKGCCDGLTVVRVTDSDVAYNTSYSWTSTGETDGCSSEFYVETVTTHEIGHLIGLGHSGSSAALMYSSVSSCNNKQLGSDDTAGRNALYDCSSWTLESCAGGCKSAGQSCTSNSECCSLSCKGKPGQKTCR